MSVYRLLFAIDIRHCYFSSGWLNGASIRPTPSSERLMRQYRLLFKPTGQGAEVYYDEAAQTPGEPGSLLGFAAGEAFTFIIDNTPAELAACTAIDAQPIAAPGASLYCFGNLDGGVASFGGEDAALLHPAGEPFAGGAVPWLARRVRYTAGAPISRVAVLDALNHEPIWGPQDIAPPASQVSFTLDHVPEGCYLLSSPGLPDWRFYLSDVRLDGAFAVAIIHPRGSISGAGATGAPCIDASGRVSAQRYTIALEARAVTWRYFVMPATGRAAGDWQIEARAPRAKAGAGEASATFARAEGSVTVGGREAALFTSLLPLTLAERPADALKVTLTGSGLTRPIALPFPNAVRGPASFPNVAGANPPAAGAAPTADVFVYL
jgi:hypothetical protein